MGGTYPHPLWDDHVPLLARGDSSRPVAIRRTAGLRSSRSSRWRRSVPPSPSPPATSRRGSGCWRKRRCPRLHLRLHPRHLLLRLHLLRSRLRRRHLLRRIRTTCPARRIPRAGHPTPPVQRPTPLLRATADRGLRVVQRGHPGQLLRIRVVPHTRVAPRTTRAVTLPRGHAMRSPVPQRRGATVITNRLHVMNWAAPAAPRRATAGRRAATTVS